MSAPALSLCDQQTRHPVDVPRLEELAAAALPLVLPRTGPEEIVLPNLSEVEVTFIDDATIARVHGEFLDDPAPTDVITFHHGEILISTDTARRQAAEHGEALQRELALYVIHGLLHLNGHEDLTSHGAALMRREQESILEQLWPRQSQADAARTS